MSGMSRRRFLLAGAAGAAASALSAPKKARAAPGLEGYPDGMGVLVDLMLMRDREGRALASDGRSGEPRVVVVVDELADLLMITFFTIEEVEPAPCIYEYFSHSAP